MTRGATLNHNLVAAVKPVLDRRLTPIDVTKLYPVWSLFLPCRVKVLLLADGGLDFSDSDFGMSAFVEALKTTPGNHVRFDITLAHIEDVAGVRLQEGAPGIVRSIPNFRFDNPDHFTPDKYDQVWLFGIRTQFLNRGLDSQGQPYPATRLGDAELVALSQFMNQRGGLFATGDHGALGKALCHAIPRARSMRRWDPTVINGLDVVSMSGPQRKDTNRIGTVPGSHFDDQSDDVPQQILPKLYSRRTGIWRYRFPHPIFCGPQGMIKVMPDHAHEGECMEAANPNQTVNLPGLVVTEYPAATDGGARPLPEIIARSTVLSGTTSGNKSATNPHTFGAMSAYDGHRASVGRVVTEATWHHYTNINLIGREFTNNAVWAEGFLHSAAGQAHLEQIFTYMRNIAVWLSRPEQLKCMRRRLTIWTLKHERVVEAVISQSHLPLRKADLYTLMGIGKHARDVLGQFVGACQTSQIIFDIIRPFPYPKLHREFDIWNRPPELEAKEDFLPFIDLDPMLDATLGGALLSLHDVLDSAEGEKISERQLDDALTKGAEFAFELSRETLGRGLTSVAGLTDGAPPSGTPPRPGVKRPKKR